MNQKQKTNRNTRVLAKNWSRNQTFDTKKNETRSMRSKEEAHDYRYFPDPDLLPLEIEQSFVDSLKKFTRTSWSKKDRFIKDFKISPYEANVLVSDNNISLYFEDVIKNSDINL